MARVQEQVALEGSQRGTAWRMVQAKREDFKTWPPPVSTGGDFWAATQNVVPRSILAQPYQTGPGALGRLGDLRHLDRPFLLDGFLRRNAHQNSHFPVGQAHLGCGPLSAHQLQEIFVLVKG